MFSYENSGMYIWSVDKLITAEYRFVVLALLFIHLDCNILS